MNLHGEISRLENVYGISPTPVFRRCSRGAQHVARGGASACLAAGAESADSVVRRRDRLRAVSPDQATHLSDGCGNILFSEGAAAFV